MPKWSLGWLIEQAEDQLEAVLQELKNPELSQAEKKASDQYSCN